MNRKCFNAVLMVYGEGGHSAQMRRLSRFFPSLQSENAFYVSLSDDKRPDWSDYHFQVGHVRDKNRNWNFFKTIYRNFYNLIRILSIFRQFDVKLVVSTGPGLVIIPATVARVLKINVIHVETWSRFNSYSLTGRLMYKIASEFWIQNKSLQELYPKAKYVGLL